jgi:hypothetical protein
MAKQSKFVHSTVAPWQIVHYATLLVNASSARVVSYEIPQVVLATPIVQ